MASDRDCVVTAEIARRLLLVDRHIDEPVGAPLRGLATPRPHR